MKATSPLYRRLREQPGSWYETQVVRGSVVYGDNVLEPYDKNIHKLDINPALFDDGGPQIGIARASKCRLEIFEERDNWPRGASFLVQMRLHSEDDSEVSEWLPMGVFYTDRRVPDDTGYLSITAYDGMLLLEQSWTDKVQTLPSRWPITAKAAAALLEEATGIELENDDILDDVVAFIGLDTESSARDVWSDIAAAHGCNLTMTPLGKLRLVELAALPSGSYTGAVADIAIADRAVADTDGSGQTPEAYFDLGADVSTLGPGDDLPEITGVELRTEAGAKAFAGDRRGYILKGVCNFSDSAAAALCLARMRGRFYRPFSAVTAYAIDPAADPGDLVSIEDRIYQVMAMAWTICAKPTADLSAEFEEEIDHEYPVQSTSGKALRIARQEAQRYTDAQAVELRSYIAQEADSIRQGVAATYVDNTALANTLANYSPTAQIEENYYNKAQTGEHYYSKAEADSMADALAGEISLTDQRLTIAFSQLRADTNDAVNAMSYYIRYQNGVVIIGKTDSPTSIRISNEQIGLFYGEEMLSYWNENRQFTPKELQIPAGGKFTLGSALWQPRTSGNLSVMWVG